MSYLSIDHVEIESVHDKFLLLRQAVFFTKPGVSQLKIFVIKRLRMVTRRIVCFRNANAKGITKLDPLLLFIPCEGIFPGINKIGEAVLPDVHPLIKRSAPMVIAVVF